VFSADGSRIAFFSAGKQPGIYQRASDGAVEDKLLFPVDPGQVLIPSGEGWSHGGRFLLMTTSNPGAASGVNLSVLVLADRKIVPLPRSEFHEVGRRLLPRQPLGCVHVR
jgi:hypothetical protein